MIVWPYDPDLLHTPAQINSCLIRHISTCFGRGNDFDGDEWWIFFIRIPLPWNRSGLGQGKIGSKDCCSWFGSCEVITNIISQLVFDAMCPAIIRQPSAQAHANNAVKPFGWRHTQENSSH